MADPKDKKQAWKERMMRSQYFIIALLVHVAIALMFGSIVAFRYFAAAPDMAGQHFIVGDGGGSPPPPAASSAAESQTESIEVPTQVANPTEIMAVDVPSPDSFTVPVPTIMPTISKDIPKTSATVQTSRATFDSRASAIRNMMQGWGMGGSGSGGSGSGSGFGPGGSKANLQAEFVCYLAQYADGNWRATVNPDGPIQSGSLPNLLRMINLYSKGRIKAKVVPEPLRLDSQEIFDKKPPFIFFNGHKDFRLTEKEVENLRKYLIQGGAIWGDNALAGAGSRFDVAFRREMKRVIPDEDKPFEIIPESHDIYKKSFFPLSGAPEGMNYYSEPLECVNIDGFIAILYTPNNYGDLMRMAFIENTTTPDLKTGPGKHYVTPKSIWDFRETFYRNFEPQGADQAFRLGINIIVHLLTRFQERLMLSS